MRGGGTHSEDELQQNFRPVFCLQGNGIDRAETAGCNGAGWKTGASYTLNTIDRPAVCFQQNQRDEVRDMGEHSGAITAAAGMKNRNYLIYPDKARTLIARGDSSPCADKGANIVCYDARGNGGGNVSPTMTGQHNANVTDYTTVVVTEGKDE